MRLTVADYLDACARGDVEAVESAGNAFWGVRELRDSPYKGLTGLMYAALYGYDNLFAYLLPHECGVALGCNFTLL